MPPISAETAGFMYHGCSGIGRGILFVLTGSPMVGFLNPRKLPMKVSGKETPSHRKTRANMVVNGTALEDFSTQRTMFKVKNIRKTAPGTTKAVLMASFFHSEPPNIL
jgi:hypothetical protein